MIYDIRFGSEIKTVEGCSKIVRIRRID